MNAMSNPDQQGDEAPPRHSDVSYEDLDVGATYGPFTETVDAQLADSMRETIGVQRRGAVAPPAVFPILFLRGLRRAMGGIPPGSVLAKQDLEFHAPVAVGSEVEVLVRVSEKYVRRERQYAVIEFEIANDNGELALIGHKVIVWPAPKEV